MSQSSRSRARAMVRWRNQAARLIAEATVGPDIVCGMCQGSGVDFDCECPCPGDRGVVYHDEECTDVWCGLCGGEGTGRAAMRIALLHGEPFDVHAVREHAKRLIGMEHEQAVFEDWCRDRGLHADDIDGEAVRQGDAYRECTGVEIMCGSFSRGGWPHGLARAWPGKPSAAMGRNLARQGQRLLDILDGRCAWNSNARPQPSECQACVAIHTSVVLRAADGGLITTRPGQRVAFVTQPGVRVVGRDGQPRDAEPGEAAIFQCAECRGTGHNLRGYLPPIEVPGPIRRRAVDLQAQLPPGREWPSWMSDLGIHSGHAARWSASIRPRTDPRGENTTSTPEVITRDDGTTVALCDQMRGWICKGGFGTDRWPAWKRGEIKRQRRRMAVRPRRQRAPGWPFLPAPMVVDREMFAVDEDTAAYLRGCWADRRPVDAARLGMMDDGRVLYVDRVEVEGDNHGRLRVRLRLTAMLRVQAIIQGTVNP